MDALSMNARRADVHGNLGRLWAAVLGNLRRALEFAGSPYVNGDVTPL
jgi:hypothetical protein